LMVRMKGASAGVVGVAVVWFSGVVMRRSVFRLTLDYRGLAVRFRLTRTG